MMIRLRRYLCGIALLATTACGDDLIPETEAPPEVTFSGFAVETTVGPPTPQEGVLIEIFAADDETTPAGSTTTDANGQWSVTVETGGVAFDGFVRASKAGLIDTYVYPSAPLVADFENVAVNQVTLATFDTLANTLCRAMTDETKATIAVRIDDSAGEPVGGAVVTSNPAAASDCYNADTGFPDPDAASSAADGLGFLFNVEPGNVSVTATADGHSFQTTRLKARVGVLNTAVIVE